MPERFQYLFTDADNCVALMDTNPPAMRPGGSFDWAEAHPGRDAQWQQQRLGNSCCC